MPRPASIILQIASKLFTCTRNRSFLGYYASAARAAEQLRQQGVDIVFVAGCEMTLFSEGILEGNTIVE